MFSGMSRALRAPRLVALLWLLKLALAVAVALPGWLVARSWLGVLPEADALRDGLRIGVLADLAELRPGFFGSLTLSALGLAGLGLLAGLAAAGGVLPVLCDREARPLAERFGSGALRFFGPFLRVGLLSAPIAALALALVIAPLGLLVRRAEHAPPLVQAASLVALLAGAGLVVVLSLSVTDAARIALVRCDGRRAWPALAVGARRVLRQPVRWAGVRLANLLLVAALVSAYALVESRLPGASRGALLLGLLLAQAVAFAQSGVRVSLLAGELALWDAQLPASVAEAAQVPLEPFFVTDPIVESRAESTAAPEALGSEPEASEPEGVALGDEANRPR